MTYEKLIGKYKCNTKVNNIKNYEPAMNAKKSQRSQRKTLL